MVGKAILAGILAYAVTCLICELFKKSAKKDENYGGDGSFKCGFCHAPLTYQDTIHRVRCPSCKKYFYHARD
jgi:LSD1 subclass zinc finger protein